MDSGIAQPRRSADATLALVVAATAQFVVALDISIVNVALPSLRRALDLSDSALPWVVNAYTLALGGLLLLGGRLGDLYGRRRLLAGSFALFALASLGGGLAQSGAQLVTCRALQGVAAAGLAPAALALLSTSFPSGPERARALAVWAAVTAAGGAVGVLAGGLLTELAGWRWILFVNVPIVVAALIAVLRLPREADTPGAPRRLDLPGALLATGGATALVFGVLRAGEDGWGSAAALVTLALAVALLGAFALTERRTAQPLVRPGLFARRRVALSNVTMALLCAGQFAAFYFVSLLLQERLGYGPIEAGLAFLPFCLGIVAGATIATRQASRRTAPALVTPGALLAAAGLLWFGAASAGDGFLGALLGPMLLTSVGLGLCFVPVTSAATAEVAPQEAGMAAGVLNASRQIGGAIGLAALVTVGQPPALAVGAVLMVLAAATALGLG